MSISLASFADELEKLSAEEKEEEPGWMARHPGAVVGGKLLAANVVLRHGSKLPPVRWLGKEIAGVGARAGLAGKPMLNRPIREILALGIDPQMVSVYEGAHAAGRAARGRGVKNLKGVAGGVAAAAKSGGMPGVADAAKFISEVPLKSKGGRRVADAVLAPKQSISNIAGRVRDAAKRLIRRR